MTTFCPCFFCILIAERKQVVVQPHGHFLTAFHLLGNNCVRLQRTGSEGRIRHQVLASAESISCPSTYVTEGGDGANRI